MLTKSIFTVVFLIWTYLMLPFRAIFNEILKVNYTNLEYFVWGQNNTIRRLNALAF